MFLPVHGRERKIFMPQMNKGGKFIFGKSLIHENGELYFPAQATKEYSIADEGRVCLFTGSKATGGFCVTRKGLLLPSKLRCILTENPNLADYSLKPGEFIRYKGRAIVILRFRLRQRLFFQRK